MAVGGMWAIGCMLITKAAEGIRGPENAVAMKASVAVDLLK